MPYNLFIVCNLECLIVFVIYFKKIPLNLQVVIPLVVAGLLARALIVLLAEECFVL